MEILHDVSLDAAEGEVVALLGPNGSGKTTILKSIFSLADVMRGAIKFRDQDITHTPTHALLERGIAYVPQGRLVFPNLTVSENLEMGAFLLNHEETKEKNMAAVFKQFPVLEKRSKEKSGNLSGGEQQMLALGRALMMTPTLLLLDEPSLGLSPKITKEIFGHIALLAKSGMTILIVEQNVHLALQVAHRGYLLAAGEIRFAGTARDLDDPEKMQKLYLGK